MTDQPRPLHALRGEAVGADAACPICLAGSQPGSTLLAGPSWTLRAHPSPSPIAGWMILDLRRHAETWSDLRAEEAQEFALMMVRLTSAIERVTGCQRVYMLSFAETVHHVHAHLVPRHEADARSRAWTVADLYRAVTEGRVPAADAQECARTAQRIAEVVASTREP